MGPKVKKPNKNAFSFFLEEYVEGQRQSGRNVSMRIAAEECGPLWQELPHTEKQRFKKKAAAFKVYSKEIKENKFTNLGVSYAEFERQEEEMRKKNEAADTEVKMTISNLDAELLKMQLFYIIHCNYYCKTEKGVYVPGEIAISEFSLGDGVRRTFHRLINPGSIPFGYAYEATETIKEVHGLPYPPFEEGESDFSVLRDLILDFLKPGKLIDGRYPPLYTIENNLKASEYILSSLMDESAENYFRVYLLHKMFFWLKNKCVEHICEENVGFPVMSNAESEITRDIFRYASGISCSFHESSDDKYHNCSLSIVQRFSHIICDHCCQHIGVELIPGKHCGYNADIEGSVSEASGRTRPRVSPPRSEAEDSDSCGRSSYAGNFNPWNKRSSAGSFLHEELESKYSALEFSSVASGSSYGPSTSHWVSDRKTTQTRVHSEEEKDENIIDNKNFPKLPAGRGLSRILK